MGGLERDCLNIDTEDTALMDSHGVSPSTSKAGVHLAHGLTPPSGSVARLLLVFDRRAGAQNMMAGEFSTYPYRGGSMVVQEKPQRMDNQSKAS